MEQFSNPILFEQLLLPGYSGISVFLLEHEAIIDIYELINMAHWTTSEIERIKLFANDVSRTSWCIARILARTILSWYAKVSDSGIIFEQGLNGKPSINSPRLFFNWSHTNGCVILAVSRFFEVGVDIERCDRKIDDLITIARDFFKPHESKWILSRPKNETGLRFLSVFIQKEAYLKMTGEGLSGSIADAPASLKLPPYADGSSALFSFGENEKIFFAVNGHSAKKSNIAFTIHHAQLDRSMGIPSMECWKSFVPK